MDSNKLENLNGFAKSFLPKLRKLSLSENNITEIPEISMPELLDFEAEENKIVSIEFLKKCEKIEQVFLNKNEIASFPEL